MRWPWQRWLSRNPPLDENQRARLRAWQTGQAEATPSERCVVLDVETTGLNLKRDRLISIGAVAVVAGRVALGDSYSVVVQQQASSTKENILLHGISGTVQTTGMPAAEALLGFLEYIGRDPLVAFHVRFDETMISRALQETLGIGLQQEWLDLAYVMPALFPREQYRNRALDDWTQQFGILNAARHDALADAMVTAELMLVALRSANHGQAADFKALKRLEREYRHARQG